MAKTLAQLVDELAPAARKAFLDAIAAIRSDVTLARIEAAIQRGDVQAALDALNLEASYFRPLDDLLRQAVLQGGDYAIDELKRLAPRNTVTGRFDATNPTAADILARYSSGRVVEISETTRDGLRLALSTAMETDASPRKVALDLVGRINRVTGRREGGLVGLNSQRIAWAQAAQAELQSGDGAQMANYLTRKSRDARFDPTVRAAIRAGKPVPADKVQAAMQAMNNRLLRDRGETIARTELLQSLNAGQQSGIQQAIDRGQLNADQVRLEWDSSADSFVRNSHRDMDGQTRPFGQPFTTPDGYLMMHPGDSTFGAPAGEIINCRCRTIVRLDLVTGLKSRLTADELASTRALF
jgi:hypothetical protein